ncbi:universal stress protein [Desertibaculum subflavum]|uniref:universal stress protein n=1 Tax=Desertibaculum subflavum TaxID=2268458 RepID=UPI0013C4327E
MLSTILVPIDGSAPALQALDHAIAVLKQAGGGELHLVNVQPPVDNLVTTFVGKAEVSDYHREEGMKALEPAMARCQASGITPKLHIGVGRAGAVIAGFVKSLGAGQIVMGARGLGGAAGVLLGSVSRDVIAEAKVPVTVVK